MPRKTSDQHQNNSRLGALGESLVQTFLLEYADFCYPTQEKHPADLMVEFGSAKYTVQVKSRRATKEKKFEQDNRSVHLSLVSSSLCCWKVRLQGHHKQPAEP